MAFFTRFAAVLCLSAALTGCNTAQNTDFDSSPLYAPTRDFPVFWQQVSAAILTQDVDRLLALSRSSTGAINFDRGYGALYPARNGCERRALTAYLRGSLDERTLIAAPRRTSPGPLTVSRAWGDVLRSGQVPRLEGNPAVTRTGGSDSNPYYRYGLVSFGKNPVDNTWILAGFTHSEERMFGISDRAGGPGRC